MSRDEAIQVCKLLNALIELSQVEKILGTFIRYILLSILVHLRYNLNFNTIRESYNG